MKELWNLLLLQSHSQGKIQNKFMEKYFKKYSDIHSDIRKVNGVVITMEPLRLFPDKATQSTRVYFLNLFSVLLWYIF